MGYKNDKPSLSNDCYQKNQWKQVCIQAKVK